MKVKQGKGTADHLMPFGYLFYVCRPLFRNYLGEGIFLFHYENQELERMGHSTAHIWREIETLIAKTMIAITPELKIEMSGEVPPGRRKSPYDCQ